MHALSPAATLQGSTPHTPAGCRVLVYQTVTMDEATNTEPTATLQPAGATAPQQSQDSDANACSYGETYRAAVRGGAYVATPADYPQPSLYVRSCFWQCHGAHGLAVWPSNCAWLVAALAV